MRRYNAYNPSPVIWNTEFPAGWKFIRGKNLYKKENRPTRNFDKVVTCFRDGQVTLRENRRTTGFTESIKEIGYQGIRKGDLVIHVMDAFAGAIGVSDSDGKGSPIYSVCTAKRDVNNYYYAYLLREVARNGYIKSLYRGIRERSSDFRFEVFANEFYPVPPRAEQDQIVRFLDWKVSEINKLIGIRRKEIQELEELKDNIIFQATTSGLNKNVPMKRTGNRWLGTIPEQWDVVQVRRAYSVILGKMLSLKPLDFTYTYENYVCAKDVHFDGVNLSNLKKMWFSTAEKKQYKIKTGDLLVVEGGAGAGNAALVDEPLEHEVFVQNSIHIIRPKNNLTTNKFLAYWIKSLVRRDYMKFVCNVATIPHYTKDKVMSTVMPLPPLKEQQEIVRYLADESLKIENLINKKHSQITVFQELKGSLISDVVTGKIDVRNIPVPAYEHVDDMVADGGEGNDEEPRIPGEED